jgi:competence protein ComEA
MWAGASAPARQEAGIRLIALGFVLVACTFVAPRLAMNLRAAQAPAAPAFTMPAGAGKETFESVCSLCHNPIAALGKQFTKAEWEAKVTEMLQEEPDVTMEERAAIVGYLTATFKPGGKIYVNIIAAKDLATLLDLTIDQGNAIVQQRDQRGAFKTIEELKAVPGMDAAKLEAKRDRLAF